MQDTPPSVSEEIQRKLCDEAMRVLQGIEQGAIPEGEGKSLLGTLWAATAGLVDNDVSHEIAAHASRLPATVRKRHFLSVAGAVMTFAWYDAKPNALLLIRTPGKPQVHKAITGEPEERLKTINDTAAQLKAAGWIEL